MFTRHFFTMIFLVFLTFVPFSSSQNNEISPTIQVHREAELFDNGILLIKDSLEISVHNIETTQLSRFFLGFNKSVPDGRQSFQVFINGEEIQSTVNSVNVENFTGFEIIFSRPINLIEGAHLKIEAFYSFINLNEYLGSNYLVSIPVYPVLETGIDKISFELLLPRDLSLENLTSPIPVSNTTVDGRLVIQHESENIPPFNEELVDIAYTLPENVYVAICELLEYEIQIQSEELLIQETVRIKNLGFPLLDFQIPVINGATNIQAKDKVGPLNVKYNSSDGNIFASLKPRLALFNGSKWEFTIFYWVDESLYVNRNSHRELDFLTPNFPLFVDNLQVQIVLPKGSDVIESMENANVLEEDQGTSVIHSYRKVFPSEQKNVNLKFEVRATSTLVLPIALLLILIISVIVLYYLRKKKVREPREQRRVPQGQQDGDEVEEPELEALIRQYNERADLLRELVKIDSDISEGEINQAEYDRRSAEVARKNSRLIATLRQIESSVKIEDEDTEQKVKNLKRVLLRLSKLENDLRSLENRYNAGRISRRNYFDRRNRLGRRRKEILTHMERILKTLN